MELLSCSEDGTVCYMSFTNEELGTPISRADKVTGDKIYKVCTQLLISIITIIVSYKYTHYFSVHRHDVVSKEGI